METQERIRLYTNRWQGSDYVLGTYRFWIVAWLRGFLYVSAKPNRSVFLDRYEVILPKESKL